MFLVSSSWYMVRIFCSVNVFFWLTHFYFFLSQLWSAIEDICIRSCFVMDELGIFLLSHSECEREGRIFWVSKVIIFFPQDHKTQAYKIGFFVRWLYWSFARCLISVDGCGCVVWCCSYLLFNVYCSSLSCMWLQVNCGILECNCCLIWFNTAEIKLFIKKLLHIIFKLFISIISSGCES